MTIKATHTPDDVGNNIWTIDDDGLITAIVMPERVKTAKAALKVYTTPADDTPPVPASVTPLQARGALRAWGIGRDQIAAFFAAIDDPGEREAAEDAWEYATSIDRGNPLIASCASYLGKSDEEVDAFFRDAAAL